jgi:hypothetical protein
LLAHDDIGLFANLAVTVTDNGKYKQFLARRGPGAQVLLDLLQAVRSQSPFSNRSINGCSFESA